MKSMSRLVFVGAAVLTLLASVTTIGCLGWQHDVTLSGVAFSKARVTDTGLVIGRIAADQTIAGRPCRKGWVHLHPNGTAAGFTSSAEISTSRFVLPPGTWVSQSTDGTITLCALPYDMAIQGQVCRGGRGGSEGVQVAFYASGALKEFFPRTDVIVDGVPCAANPFRFGVELYENGRLCSAILSREFAIDGRHLSKGTRIHLSPSGKLSSDADYTSTP